MSNLSEIKRKEALDYLDTLRKRLTNDYEIKAINEIESLLLEKKFGLLWEEHEERVDIEIKNKIPIFLEQEDYKINGSRNEYNFLLEGDNLHSLYLLEKTHKNRIEFIYIDPPYNTGNKDFKYNDRFLVKDDDFKHSQWLSFMEKRLFIAKNLLTDDGVIFISIDDNEYAPLKMLCDEIFGERNSLGPFIQDKKNDKNDTLNIQKNHEYILVYRKKELKKKLKDKDVTISTLQQSKIIQRNIILDGDTSFYLSDPLTTRGDGGVLAKRKNLGYTIYFHPITKDFMPIMDYNKEKALISNIEEEVYSDNQELIDKGYVKIRAPRVRGNLGAWTWEYNRIVNQKKDVYIKETRSGYSVHRKIYVPKSEVYESGGRYYYDSINNQGNSKSIIEYPTSEGTDALSKLIGKGKFNNPKNVEMIKYFIRLFPKKNITVLDFFAGSGTTAQAVIEQNIEDRGTRRFILCTNNENGISKEVTYPRLTALRKLYDFNLKYFKTDKIEKFSGDEILVSEKLMYHIKEMIELENFIDISDSTVGLVFSEQDLEEIVNNNKISKINKLYIPSFVFLTKKQESIIKKYKIVVREIPEIYFPSELREVGEL